MEISMTAWLERGFAVLTKLPPMEEGKKFGGFEAFSLAREALLNLEVF